MVPVFQSIKSSIKNPEKKRKLNFLSKSLGGFPKYSRRLKEQERGSTDKVYYDSVLF